MICSHRMAAKIIPSGSPSHHAIIPHQHQFTATRVHIVGCAKNHQSTPLPLHGFVSKGKHNTRHIRTCAMCESSTHPSPPAWLIHLPSVAALSLPKHQPPEKAHISNNILKRMHHINNHSPCYPFKQPTSPSYFEPRHSCSTYTSKPYTFTFQATTLGTLVRTSLLR